MTSPGLRVVRLQPINSEAGRAAHFCGPVLILALLIFPVDHNERVRINPAVLRNNRILQNYRLAHVISRSPVMGKNGTTDRERQSSQPQPSQSIFVACLVLHLPIHVQTLITADRLCRRVLQR